MNRIKQNITVFIICLLISIFMGCILGELPSLGFFDFHQYNGWAFLTGRYDVDTLPVSFRTYFNPVVDAVEYLILSKMNNFAALYNILENLWYCAFIFISYLLFSSVYRNNDADEKRRIIIICMLLTIFSPILLLTHKFWNSMQTSVIVLLAIYLFLQNVFSEESKKKTVMLGLCALLFGLSTGLKYTCGSFAAAFIVCVLVNRKYIKNFAGSCFMYGISMLAGFMLGGGWWMYFLYNRFHNPLYPYLNNIFNDGTNSVLIQDYMHLRPKSVWEFVFYPLLNSRTNTNIGLEFVWYDIKIPLAFISVLIYWLLYRLKNLKDMVSEIIDLKIFNTIVIFTAVSWVVNLVAFAQVRYLIPLLPLTAVIIAIICWILVKMLKKEDTLPNMFITLAIAAFCFYVNQFRSMQDFGVVIFAVFVLCFLYLMSFYWKKGQNIKNKGYFSILMFMVLLFFGTAVTPIPAVHILSLGKEKVVEIEKLNIEDDAAVLLTMGTGFFAPEQNPKAKYLGLIAPKELVSAEDMNDKKADVSFQDNNQEKELKEVFESLKNVYLLFMGDFQEKVDKYEPFISYYSHGAANKIDMKNCRKVHYQIYGFYTPVDYYFCRLK